MATWRRWGAAIAMTAFLGPGQAAAQVSASVNTHITYTDNLFQDHTRQSDWITLTYVDLDLRTRSGLGAYYTGRASAFAEYGDLFSHRHQVGLTYARSGKNGRMLYSGVELSARLDRPLYDYNDYLQGDAYLSGSTVLAGGLRSQAGYRARYREYPRARDFSYGEHALFLRFTRSWQTGTTVLVRGELGVKSLLRRSVVDSLLSDVRLHSDGASTLAQATVRFRIAQAVARGTGLQLEVLQRTTLMGSNRYTELQSTDGELFDDRYSHAGTEISGAVKHQAGRDLTAKATVRCDWRRYEDRPALDLDGVSIEPFGMRRDSRKSLLVEVGKTFGLGGGPVEDVGIRLEWLYQDVDSNDPYYRAATRVYSVGVQVAF